MRKIAVITGAGSGIGAATAEYFSSQSWLVILLGRNLDRLKTVQSKLRHPGWCIELDLMQSDSIQTAAQQILKIYSQEETFLSLINNAGIYENKKFMQTDAQHWQSQFQTNLFGPVELTRTILPEMIKAKRGTIVNVSSTLGLRSIVNTSAYSATKSAMNSWTQTLALELGEYQIRVNAVCPGIIDTPIHPFHSLPNEEKKAVFESMAAMQPLGRVGDPMDVAKSIFYLASELSTWSTGTLIPVDGGINLT